MKIFCLLACILAQALFPVIGEYGLKQAIPPLYLALAQASALVVFGFMIGSARGTVGSTLKQIVAPRRRWPFVAVNILSVGAALSAVYAFKGDSTDQRESLAPATVANMVDLVGTLVLAWLAAWILERSRASRSVPNTAPGESPRTGHSRVRWYTISWEIFWTSVAVFAVLIFTVPPEQRHQLRVGLLLSILKKPEVYFALLWAAFGVGLMHITRKWFSRQEVDTGGYLTWRYLGPSIIYVLLLVASRFIFSHPSAPLPRIETFMVLAAFGASFILAIWFQYESLRGYSVIVIARVSVAIPVLTYLIDCSISSARWNPSSFGLCMVVVVALLAIEYRPYRRASQAGAPEAAVRSEPPSSTPISLLLALGIALSLISFAPVIWSDLGNIRKSPDGFTQVIAHHGVLFLFILPATAAIFTLAFRATLGTVRTAPLARTPD